MAAQLIALLEQWCTYMWVSMQHLKAYTSHTYMAVGCVYTEKLPL